MTKVYDKNSRKEMIRQFNDYLGEASMKHLTTNHYNNYEFELSYEINGEFKQDVFISIDPTDYSIYGLPAELEDYEELIQDNIEENWGDIVEDMLAVDQIEYNDYVKSIVG